MKIDVLSKVMWLSLVPQISSCTITFQANPIYMLLLCLNGKISIHS